MSICWAAPLILFQNFASVQHHWYLAPTLPFLAILTYEMIFWLKKQFPFFKYLFFGVLVFTLIRQAAMFNSPDKKSKFISENQEILINSKRIINLVPNLSQSLILNLYQCNPNQIFDNNFADLEKSDIIFIRKKDQRQLPSTLHFDDFSQSKESEFSILKKR